MEGENHGHAPGQKKIDRWRAAGQNPRTEMNTEKNKEFWEAIRANNPQKARSHLMGATVAAINRGQADQNTLKELLGMEGAVSHLEIEQNGSKEEKDRWHALLKEHQEEPSQEEERKIPQGIAECLKRARQATAEGNLKSAKKALRETIQALREDYHHGAALMAESLTRKIVGLAGAWVAVKRNKKAVKEFLKI
jgi:soluble cytochrome b562